MSVRDTFLLGEAVLRETAEKVSDISDPTVQVVIDDLIETMLENDLAGMAAPQIGESLRICVTELRETKYRSAETDRLRIYVNPEIVHVSRETELDWEGCGSIPGIFGQVERPKEVDVEFYDREGKKHHKHCTGLLARAVQHEVDHLNGILLTDLADPRTLVSREYYLEHIRGT